MKALLSFFFRAPRLHDDTLRANQDHGEFHFSPYVVMLPGAQG